MQIFSFENNIPKLQNILQEKHVCLIISKFIIGR